ncbi:MAG: MFS transporter [Chloroflexota bacterium]|nr:MAG: MFS transporter [Chloroflexota bacterium]
MSENRFHISIDPRLARLKESWLASLHEIWQQAWPGESAWKGAAAGLWLASLVLVTLLGSSGIPIVGNWLDVLFWLAISLLGPALLGFGMVGFLALAQVIPRGFLWAGSGVTLIFTGAMISLLMGLGVYLGRERAAWLGALLGVGVCAAAALLGGAINSLRSRGLNRLQQSLAFSSLVLALALLFGALLWTASPGQDGYLAAPAPAGSQPLQIEDPSLPGDWAVNTLYYGSGSDRRRPEYASGASLVTSPVDGSAFVSGWKEARSRYWGFDSRHMPLNGRVWYPEGDGPFPLVVMAHGNHDMMEFSDPGYAYLGELLASRGFIFVSIDENFFNDGPAWHGDLSKENDGRGWLMLQHLRLWRQWNETEGNPFYGQVDMENIALAGHSRGGEAAAIAAAFNRLPRYPENASIVFDFGFAIQAVISLAPIDGQYYPAGQPTALEDIDYLVLQGSHDSDVSAFAGIRQWQRVSFSGESYRFKAAIYIDRLNHSQFNTGWGAADRREPLSWMLNVKPLLPAGEQQQIARVYLSAFLEAALRNRSEYLPVFLDPHLAAGWLPETVYLARFEDSTFIAVSDFQEDADLTTTTLPGGVQLGEDLQIWREKELRFTPEIFGSVENNVLDLGWTGVASPSLEMAAYSIDLSEAPLERLQLDEERRLAFSLAAAGSEDGQIEETEAKNQILSLYVELVDADGDAARLGLDEIGPQPQALRRQFTQWAWFERPSAEPVFQTYTVALGAFKAVNPRFDSAGLDVIRFLFARTSPGELFLDDLGFMSGN